MNNAQNPLYVSPEEAVTGLGIKAEALRWALRRRECAGLLVSRKDGWLTTRDAVMAWLATKATGRPQ